MKPVSWLLRLVGMGFLFGLLSTNATNTLDKSHKGLGNYVSRRDSGVLGVFRAVLRRLRGRSRVRGSPKSDLGFARGLSVLRGKLRDIYRRGWSQFYLPRDTESAEEHIDDCVDILMEVATELGLTIDEANRGRKTLQIHELDEVERKKDIPLVPTREMPRSRVDRVRWFREEWIPPDRGTELRRLREEYEGSKDLIIKWVEEQLPEDQWKFWIELIEDFYLVRGKVAEICFEVHAFQPAQKAVFIVIAVDDRDKFPPEAADPFIMRAERIITLPNLTVRLDILKQTLSELKGG